MANLKVDGQIVDKSGNIQSYPVGTIIISMNSTIPDGWLLCDGRPVNTADYPDLYAVIGATYGSGSGVFNLPPLVVNATHNPNRRIPVGTVSSEPTYPSVFGHSHGTTTFDFPATVASSAYSHAHNANTFGANNTAAQSHGHNYAGGTVAAIAANATNNLRASSTNTTQYLNTNHSHGIGTQNHAVGGNNAADNAHGHNHFGHGTESSSHTHSVTYSGNTATSASTEYYPVSVQAYFLIKA